MAEPLPPNSIFLCYRRADSEEMVDRIYEILATAFGKAAVFRDIDTIPVGIDFPAYIQNALRDCPVTLVFIGREWATCTDSRGRQRLADPGDHVRIEVETALALPDARIIPILVKRGEIPDEEELPASLRPLRRRSGMVVRSAGQDFKNDIAHLSRLLEDAVKSVLATRQARAPERPPEPAAPAPAADQEPSEIESVAALADDIEDASPREEPPTEKRVADGHPPETATARAPLPGKTADLPLRDGRPLTVAKAVPDLAPAAHEGGDRRGHDAVTAPLTNEVTNRKKTVASPKGVIQGAIFIFVLLLALVGGYTTWSQHREKFPGREQVEGMLTAAEKMTPSELESVSMKTGELGDWFYVRGYEGFEAPSDLAGLQTIGARAFHFDGRTMAQMAIGDGDSLRCLVFEFHASEFGVKLPEDGDWKMIVRDDWVGAVRQHGDKCFLIVFKGTKADMEDFLKTLKNPSTAEAAPAPALGTVAVAY